MCVCSESAWYRQSWPKCVGQSVFFPNCCSFRSLPPSPPMQCWTTGRQAFPYEQHCMGGGGESRIWPKERWFPCEKLIDGRGSAFCKLVPHNFGQDCTYLPTYLYTYLCTYSLTWMPSWVHRNVYLRTWVCTHLLGSAIDGYTVSVMQEAARLTTGGDCWIRTPPQPAAPSTTVT